MVLERIEVEHKYGENGYPSPTIDTVIKALEQVSKKHGNIELFMDDDFDDDYGLNQISVRPYSNGDSFVVLGDSGLTRTERDRKRKNEIERIEPMPNGGCFATPTVDAMIKALEKVRKKYGNLEIHFNEAYAEDDSLSVLTVYDCGDQDPCLILDWCD